jgi:hypothetical protein
LLLPCSEVRARDDVLSVERSTIRSPKQFESVDGWLWLG